MSSRVDVRVIFPVGLSAQLREYVNRSYSGQKGAITLTITQAVTEFLDRVEARNEVSPSRKPRKGEKGA